MCWQLKKGGVTGSPIQQHALLVLPGVAEVEEALAEGCQAQLPAVSSVHRHLGGPQKVRQPNRREP
eukprot:SAG31_NODE_457_length_15415_cov_4.380387_7_plen_66_part_00